MRLVSDLVDGVQRGEVPPLTGAEAREILAVILTALRSSREGRALEVVR